MGLPAGKAGLKALQLCLPLGLSRLCPGLTSLVETSGTGPGEIVCQAQAR